MISAKYDHMLRRAMRFNPFRRRKPEDDASGQSEQGGARRGWSQEFEYRKPKKKNGHQISCNYIFNNDYFESGKILKKLNKFSIEGYINTRSKLLINILNFGIYETKDIFSTSFDQTIEPFSKKNPGSFDIKFDSLFYKPTGFRTIEFIPYQFNSKIFSDYDIVQAYISYFKSIYIDLKPDFGFFDTNEFINIDNYQFFYHNIVFGLTFYGKEMVEQIGREKLLSAPAYKVEEFPHGGIMLQIQENPVSYIAWPDRRKIMYHLGLKPLKLAQPDVPAKAQAVQSVGSADGQYEQGGARRGWSQEFEYREQKNVGGHEFAAIFTFDKKQFEGEEFQAAARELFWDEASMLVGEVTWPRVRDDMENKLNKQFPQGMNIHSRLMSEPFSKSNEGFFNIVGDHEPLHGQPHIFFQRLGNRTFELTNPYSLDKMKDYDHVQAMISFFKLVFTRLKPIFGYVDRYNYIYSFKLQKDPRNYVFGLTFYGKEMVAQIGREQLLGAPVYRAEEFAHGGIMLQIHENPVSYIAWPHRRKIMSHLGLKPRKLEKPRIPEWLQKTKPPSRVRVPQGREVAVFVGLNANEIELGEDFSLYHHFYETVFPKVRGDAAPEFAFLKWFNGLDTGLEAFVTGTEFEYEFKVFVGQKVTSLKGLDAWQKRVAPDKLEAAHEHITARFRELSFTEEPYLNLLLFHGEGI